MATGETRACMVRDALRAPHHEGPAALLSVPPAGAEPLAHVGWGWRHHADRLLVAGDRHHDFAGMQVQLRLAEARSVAVNVITEDRPAGRGRVHLQLMSPSG